MEDDLNGGWLECLQNKLISMLAQLCMSFAQLSNSLLHTFIIVALHLIIDYTCACPSIYSAIMVIRYNFQSGYFNLLWEYNLCHLSIRYGISWVDSLS